MKQLISYKIRIILLFIIILVWLFFSYKIFGQEVDNSDCNLTIVEDTKIPLDFWFFTREDILKAYANLRANCPPLQYDDNSNYPQTSYFYDQLIWIGKQKLEWEAESIGLKSDPSGLALKDLWKKAWESSSQEWIDQIPSSLQAEFATIWELLGDYDENKARAYGIYTWSTWLSSKYRALCDLARWIYFNDQVTSNKLWSTTAIVDRIRLDCLNNIDQKMSEISNTQDAYLSKVQSNISQKLQQALNSDTNGQLNEMIETLSDAAQDFGDISKKIDQPMKNCNPTDV